MADIAQKSWLDFRRQMPVAGRMAYFDHAAVSPLPAQSRDAIVEWANDTAENGDAHWARWDRKVKHVRQRAARLLGADADEVALVRNTTEGVNLIAEGFPWREGDNVVVPSGEFPTNRLPWLNLAARGVETRLVSQQAGKLDLDELRQACDGRTRLLAVSWVDYSTGWRNDPAELLQVARDCGAFLFLDAIQGLGVFPLDVRACEVDFLAADGHKWLLGPEGAGVFYTRREHLDLLRPIGLGWNSVQNAGDFGASELTIKQTAARYEGGTYPAAGFIGLEESLGLLEEFGTEALGQRVLEISDVAVERLAACGAKVVSDRGEGRRSGIVAFEIPGADPAELRKRLLGENVVLSCRDGRLRISPHAYNDEEDLDRLTAALKSAVAS